MWSFFCCLSVYCTCMCNRPRAVALNVAAANVNVALNVLNVAAANVNVSGLQPLAAQLHDGL
jgi:hypothetical protein